MLYWECGFDPQPRTRYEGRCSLTGLTIGRAAFFTSRTSELPHFHGTPSHIEIQRAEKPKKAPKSKKTYDMTP
jgi:hypothetical protein